MALDQSWRPDGERESAYIDHGKRRDLWAWEFLRRNPAYQSDYEQWAALPDSESGGWSMKFDRPSWGDFELMKYFCPSDGNPSVEGETVGEYERRTGYSPEPLERVLCRKWGLITLALGDPSKIYRDAPLFATHPKHESYAPLQLDCKGAKEIFHPWIDKASGTYGTKKLIHATVVYDLGEKDSDDAKYIDTEISSLDYAVFAFDLRVDPEMQTTRVLELLRGMRERKVKQDGGVKSLVLRRRLRVLDAVKFKGGKQAPIANLLKVPADTVCKDLKAALNLVNGGYRKMAKIE